MFKVRWFTIFVFFEQKEGLRMCPVKWKVREIASDNGAQLLKKYWDKNNNNDRNKFKGKQGAEEK